jgi:hypothetical protein
MINKIERELESKKVDKELKYVFFQKENGKMEGEIESKKAFENSVTIDNESFEKRKNQKNELTLDINKLETEIQNLRKEKQLYKERIENTPKREQDLLSLKRDYDNINDAYNSLLKRKIEAQIAVDMEKNQEGEHFRILDYAQLPERPLSPNMVVLFSLTVAVGLGFGCGSIYLKELLNKTFRRPQDIEALLGIPVAVTLPVINHPEDLIKKKIGIIISVFFIFISLFLFFGLAIFTYIGVEQTLIFIQKFIPF